MKARGRAFQKQRGNWNNSPRRGQNFGFANRDASNAVTPENGSSLGDISHWDISLTRIFVVVAFTLLDEARQTSHHDNSFWSRNVQLRKKPVAFISSGSHDPLVSPQNDTEDVKDVNTKDSDTKDTDIKDSDDKTFDGKDSANKDSDNNDTHIRDTDVRDTHIQDPEVKDADVEDTYIKDPEVKDSDSKDFENTNFENRDADNITNSSKDTSNEQPAVQDVSSSDEVIVFKGRNALKRKTQTPEITLVSMQTEIRAVEEQLSVTSKEPGIHHTEEEEDSDNLLWPKKKLNKARRRRGWRDDTEEDDAMLADYIANMREHGEMMVDEEDDDDSEGTATDEAGKQFVHTQRPNQHRKKLINIQKQKMTLKRTLTILNRVSTPHHRLEGCARRNLQSRIPLQPTCTPLRSLSTSKSRPISI